MGKPEEPSSGQTAGLKTAALLRWEEIGRVTSTEDGLELTLLLLCHSVCLVEFLPT